jgi:hypothetical protein
VVILAIAGAAASTAGCVESETHVLQKLGVDAKADGWITVGLSLGGAVATGGAGLLGAGGAATQIGKVAGQMGTASTALGGAANGVSGGAGTAVAVFDARAEAAHAQLTWAELTKKMAERALVDATQEYKRVKKHDDDQLAILETTASMVGRTNATAAAAGIA